MKKSIMVFSLMAAVAVNAKGLTPNSKRYREKGGKPHTAKSGGHQVQSWGLLDKSHHTTIYITTGDLSTGLPEVGTEISKVHVKSKHTEILEKFNEKFKKLSNDGAYTFVTDKLSRGQEYEVKTHVSKDDEEKDFVITTNSKVYLLPDLKVEKIEAQEQAFLKEKVMISASIHELNHDIGGNADCVLYVNGVEAERAPGIWVDAGDTVSCQFFRQFDSVGDKTLTVRVEGASPADYDVSNNSISKVIKIVNNAVPLRTNFVSFEDLKSTEHSKYMYPDDAGALSSVSDEQIARYSAYIPGRLSDSTWTVSISETTGGNTITPFHTKELSECRVFDYPSSYDSFRQCWKLDYSTGIFLTITSHTYYGSIEQTWISYTRSWYRTVYYGATGFYSNYHYDGEIEEGGIKQFPVVGDDWRIQVEIADNGTNYVADETLILGPYNYDYTYPWTCAGDDPNKYCDETSFIQTGKYAEEAIFYE